MKATPKITTQTLRVLEAVSSGGEVSGAEIMRSTGLFSGTLYPILMRLETAGWLASRWEEDDPRTLGRPRRRFYRLTADGAQSARIAARDLQAMVQRLAWA
jgi:DNA-binding PadR family transcriptional regulator